MSVSNPSVLTKDQLKRELREAGVSLPSGDQRKDVYVELYRTNLLKGGRGTPGKGEFSSDEEDSLRGTTGRGSGKNKVLKKTVKKAASPEMDVTQLSNKELGERLEELGATVGPIVATTRRVYERKLEKLLADGPGQQNGSQSESDQYSDSEEEEEDVEEQVQASTQTSPRLEQSTNRPQTGVRRRPAPREQPADQPLTTRDLRDSPRKTRGTPVKEAQGLPPKSTRRAYPPPTREELNTEEQDNLQRKPLHPEGAVEPAPTKSRFSFWMKLGFFLFLIVLAILVYSAMEGRHISSIPKLPSNMFSKGGKEVDNAV
ncbi:TMPO [Branchiostoma lanceolatum]|uniref:TMPO protein n=2 Tax=Branchiostoma lanceolatum TaxID=7740 RepID=A0A8K0A421_BRALA|nr:TMPO [Branchiostoma lanceolatum]